MNIDRFVFAFAGALILISILFSFVHSQGWLWIAVFVSANLLQSAFTGFCPLAIILKGIGFKSGKAFN